MTFKADIKTLGAEGREAIAVALGEEVAAAIAYLLPAAAAMLTALEDEDTAHAHRIVEDAGAWLANLDRGVLESMAINLAYAVVQPGLV